MARIPVGNFGNVLPQPLRNNAPTNNTGQALAKGLQFFSGAMKEVDNAQREQEAKHKANILMQYEEQNRTAKMQADVHYSQAVLDLNNQVSLIKRDVLNGAKTQQQADEELNVWSSTRFGELEKNLPIDQINKYKSDYQVKTDSQRASFLPLQIKASQDNQVSMLDDALTVNSRNPDRQEGRQLFASVVKNANIPEAQKLEFARKFVKMQDVSDLDNRILAAEQLNSMEGLQAIEIDLNSGKYASLDQYDADRYKKSVASGVQRIQSRNEALERQRVNDAEKMYKDFRDQVMTGQALDKSLMDNALAGVAGTEYEAQVKFYIDRSNDIQAFSKRSTSEQLRQINLNKARIKNSKSANPKEEKALLDVYENIYTEKLNTAKNNPTQALRESGINVPNVNGKQIKIDPKGFVKNIVSIGSKQVSQRQGDSNAAILPIPAEALPDAQKSFREMNASQKLGFIADLIQQTKNVKNGNAVWGATLGQIGGSNPSYVMAGIAKKNNYRTAEGEDVATAIISGADLLENKQFIMPSENEMRLQFNNYVGASTTGRDANNMYSAFKSIYAHTLNRQGKAHKDSKDSADDDVAAIALRAATGGVYTQSRSWGRNFKDYSGKKMDDWKVSKPFNMSDEVFEENLDQAYKALEPYTKMSTSELKEYRLFRTKYGYNGQVAYVLKNERGNLLRYTKTGKNVLIVVGAKN